MTPTIRFARVRSNTEIILAALLEDGAEVAEALSRRGFLGLIGKILGVVSANPFGMTGAAGASAGPAPWQPRTGKAQEPTPGADRCWKCGKPGTHTLMPPLGGSVCDDCWSELNTDADILKKKGNAEVEANKKQRKERQERKRQERERLDDRSRFDYAGGSEDVGYAKHYESSLNTRIILAALLEGDLA